VRKKNPIWDFIYCLLLPKASGAGDAVEVILKYIMFNDFNYEKGRSITKSMMKPLSRS
jgi:hypothetical protein